MWDRSLVRAVFTTVSVIVLVAGLVVFVSSRDGAKVADGSGPAVAPTKSAEQLYGPEIAMPKPALRVAQKFIQTAVLRNDVAAAWALVTPHVRGGLTRTEWNLLRVFIAHAGQTLTHSQLFGAVWGNDAAGDEKQYLRVYVGQLRRKIELDPVRPQLIRTESAVGYRFVLAE